MILDLVPSAIDVEMLYTESGVEFSKNTCKRLCFGLSQNRNQHCAQFADLSQNLDLSIFENS